MQQNLEVEEKKKLATGRSFREQAVLDQRTNFGHYLLLLNKNWGF